MEEADPKIAAETALMLEQEIDKRVMLALARILEIPDIEEDYKNLGHFQTAAGHLNMRLRAADPGMYMSYAAKDALLQFLFRDDDVRKHIGDAVMFELEKPHAFPLRDVIMNVVASRLQGNLS